MGAPKEFGGISKGDVTVKDMDFISRVDTGATYSGDIRCGQRTSQTGISY